MNSDFNVVELEIHESAERFVQRHAGKTIGRGGYKHSVSPSQTLSVESVVARHVAYNCKARCGNTDTFCRSPLYSPTVPVGKHSKKLSTPPASSPPASGFPG